MVSSYSSHRVEGIRRPPLFVSWSQIIGSLTLLVIVAVGLYYVYGLVLQGTKSSQFQLLLEKPELIHSVLESGDFSRIFGFLNFIAFLIASLVAAVYCLICAISVVTTAVKLCFSGFRELLTPSKPAHLPYKFDSYDTLYKTLKEGVIEELYPSPDIVEEDILFGQRVMFVTPAARWLVNANIKTFSKRLRQIFFWLIVAAIVYWGGDILAGTGWFAGQPLQFRNQWNEFVTVANMPLFLLPIAALIANYLIMALIEYITTMLLVPNSDPSTQTVSRSKSYDGFGNPNQLVNRIPEGADELAWNGFPNRIEAVFNEIESPNLSDHGKFKSTIFIEQQPQPISDRNVTTGKILVVVGWLFQIISIGLLFTVLLPFPVLRYLKDLYVSEMFLLAPVYVFVVGILVSRILRQGIKLTKYGTTLLKSARFISESILMEIEGDISRSNITVGKATDDSVESSNLVVRSDFTVNFWAGQVLSEAQTLEAKRLPLSVEQSDHSNQWIKVVSEKIENLRSTGVVPLGVDMTAFELNSIVQVNAQANAFKKSATQVAFSAESDATIGLESDANAANLQQLPITSEGDFKICPACAETIRAKAILCRFCKTDLQPSISDETDH